MTAGLIINEGSTMNSIRVSIFARAVLGSALVLGAAPAAFADEDIYYENNLKGGYDVPPPPSDRGIYIKGYIGQATPEVGDIWTPGFQSNTFTVFHKDIKSSPLYGFGIGWQRNHWLRFDVTGEYRGDAAFFANDSYPGGVGFGPGTNEYTADISSWLGLVNAYWDICNWRGITPYVGAGIGFATISVNGLKDVNVPNSSVFYAQDSTKTNFAWAVHAGMAFDVTPDFVVDLSYRYAALGGAQSGVVTAFDGSSSYSGVHIQDITSNDLMLGVRYKLNHAQPAVYAVK
jgi:opacity protein-like surface antigen